MHVYFHIMCVCVCVCTYVCVCVCACVCVRVCVCISTRNVRGGWTVGVGVNVQLPGDQGCWFNQNTMGRCLILCTQQKCVLTTCSTLGNFEWVGSVLNVLRVRYCCRPFSCQCVCDCKSEPEESRFAKRRLTTSSLCLSFSPPLSPPPPPTYYYSIKKKTVWLRQ